MESADRTKFRHLGRSDLLISPIGLGVMQLSGGGGLLGQVFPVMPPERKNAIIGAALEGGINFFDTAEIYGNGVSEQSLATGLITAGRTDADVVIATKWFPLFRTAGNIKSTINKRIHFLEGFTISNYMVHQPFGLSSPEAEMNAMADLVEAGKIRTVGVSNFDARRMRRAHATLFKRGMPLACNQVHYSLLHRPIEKNGVLAAAKELGVTITAYTPLERGLLTGKYHKQPHLVDGLPAWRKLPLQRSIARTRPLINVMEEIASQHRATVAQVALNWLIHFNGDLVVAIPGASRVEQVEESVGAMRFRLRDDELAHLDEISRRMQPQEE